MIDRQYRARSQHPFWPVRPAHQGDRTRLSLGCVKARVARLAWPWALLLLSLRDERERRVCITRHGRVASGVAESGSVI